MTVDQNVQDAHEFLCALLEQLQAEVVRREVRCHHDKSRFWVGAAILKFLVVLLVLGLSCAPSRPERMVLHIGSCIA